MSSLWARLDKLLEWEARDYPAVVFKPGSVSLAGNDASSILEDLSKKTPLAALRVIGFDGAAIRKGNQDWGNLTRLIWHG